MNFMIISVLIVIKRIQESPEISMSISISMPSGKMSRGLLTLLTVIKGSYMIPVKSLKSKSSAYLLKVCLTWNLQCHAMDCV